MIPEQVFHRILALGEGWKVRQVNYLDEEGKVIICVEDTPGLWRWSDVRTVRVKRWYATTMRRSGDGGI